jgi:hypothetical protein
MLPYLKKTIPKKKRKTVTGKILTPFNPLNSPNTVALWDGDFTLDLNDNWADLVSGSQISFAASGTIPLTGGILNGHDTVIFNGLNQYGVSATPVISQPNTFYYILRQVTWTSTEKIFDDGVTSTTKNCLRQFVSSPRLSLVTPDTSFSFTSITLNVWKVFTVILNNINNSISIRTDLNSPIINFGLTNYDLEGITLGATQTGLEFGNCEFAYIIMRNVADSTAVQNNFINWLKNRFAI